MILTPKRKKTKTRLKFLVRATDLLPCVAALPKPDAMT